jgi:beta-xylosidase
MNSKYILTIVMSLLSAACAARDGRKEVSEPAANYRDVSFGDPFIMLHNETYYAYGTSSPNGITVYTSDDLITWQIPENNLALNKVTFEEKDGQEIMTIDPNYLTPHLDSAVVQIFAAGLHNIISQYGI